MNSSLKQKMEEAAERHSVDADACCECEAEESFKAGAQFLLDEGVRFTKEDMREAFYQGMDHQNMPWKYFGFDEWINEYIEERESK